MRFWYQNSSQVGIFAQSRYSNLFAVNSIKLFFSASLSLLYFLALFVSLVFLFYKIQNIILKYRRDIRKRLKQKLLRRLQQILLSNTTTSGYYKSLNISVLQRLVKNITRLKQQLEGQKNLAKTSQLSPTQLGQTMRAN